MALPMARAALYCSGFNVLTNTTVASSFYRHSTVYLEYTSEKILAGFAADALSIQYSPHAFRRQSSDRWPGLSMKAQKLHLVWIQNNGMPQCKDRKVGPSGPPSL